MTTYSIRCRNGQCRHRRVSTIHPDDYKVIPACPVCGQRKGWRIEQRAYNKRGLCNCSGPLGRNNEPFPHRITHPSCDQHPHGIYNQARARGVAHDDIPWRYRPMPKPEPFTHWDRYAAAVLAGVAANANTGCNSPKDFAHWAGQVADAMMAERAKRMAELDVAMCQRVVAICSASDVCRIAVAKCGPINDFEDLTK